MAGLFVLVGSNNSARLEAAARRLRFFDEITEIISDGPFGAVFCTHDDPKLFGPAYDPKTGVRVITSGRVSWEEPRWQRAEEMTHFAGGLSSRLLLDAYLHGGANALLRHNGPALLVVWDPREQRVHMFTDHFGYHPAFVFRSDVPTKAVIGTCPDVMAADAQINATRDPVAIAEFLSAWRVTPPHTYYREIQYAGAAMHYCFDLRNDRVTSREYWKPHEEEPFPNVEAAAEELAAAVSKAVRIRTLPRLGPIVCYTSGGMDSRAVLFSAAAPEQVIALNLYDVPNKEADIAKRLAESSGARYYGMARDEEYYPRWLTEGSRLSGAMWSAEDNHFLGTRDLVKSFGARTVTTACTTDWLFKGYGLEKTYARLFGRNLPLKVFTRDRVHGFLPNVPRPVSPEFADVVKERMDRWFSGTPSRLGKDADWLAVEDRRARPACYAVSVSGQIMYRIFPYDTFLADRSIADCYARSKAEWKINADLWGKTVQRICARGGHIEDANYGWRIGSSTPQKLAAFAKGWVKRRVRPTKFKADGLATDGSWPNLGWYCRNSKMLKQLWNDVPKEHRELLARAWGSNPWDRPIEQWSGAAYDVFRILTAANHLLRRP